jgi:hypothetical protein
MGVIMKLFTILFLTICVSVSFSQSIFNYNYTKRVKTGSTPTQLFNVSPYSPVVYCAGIDINYNGVKDEGDEAPSLWVLPVIILAYQSGMYINEAVKLTDLEFKMPVLPNRNYYDETTKRLYIINKSSIDTFNFTGFSHSIEFEQGKLIDDIENTSAVSAYLDKVFISVRPSMDKGFVLIYDIPTKSVIDTIQAGAGVQMTQFIGDGDALIILSEGNFGNNDGKLQLAMFQDKDSVKVMEFPIGGTPNHFYYSEDLLKIYVTCNSSNDIKIIDIAKQSIDTIKLEMAEYDGPRESMMFDDAGVDGILFTTAYDGKLYAFDDKGNKLMNEDAFGKAESCLATGYDFIIATPFQSGTYTPDTAVTVYSAPTSVSDHHSRDIKLFPNPSVNSFTLDLREDLIISEVEIVNALGITVAEYKYVSSLKNFRFDLSPGIYFLRVKHNQGLTTLPMSVVR